jgi:tetratricopeptide (TPR) repeat protein
LSPAVWIAAIAAAVYAQTLGYGLVWDDPNLLAVVEERVRAGGFRALISSPFYLVGSEHLGYYRPIVLVSFWLDTLAASVLPWSLHATNVILHAANSALVFMMFRELLPSRAAAVWGAVLFALHPVHTESVAFLSGRTDLWAAFFVLTAAVLWTRERSERRMPRPLAVAAGGGALALGGLSKEVAFAVPAVVAAGEFVLPSSLPIALRLRSAVRWIAAFAAALGAVLALRAAIPGVESGRFSMVPLPACAGRWAAYLRLLLVPWPLKAYYVAPQTTLAIPNVAGAFGALALCAATASRAWGRAGLFGLAWIAGFLLPGGMITRPGSEIVLAERFLYLPSVGFCMVAGAAIERLGRSRSARWPAVALGIAVAAAMAAGTVARNPVWKDDLSLFRDTASKTDAYLVWNNLGLAYAAEGMTSEALAQYQNALRVNPNAVKTYNNMGIALGRAGRAAEAVEWLESAVRMAPHFAEAHNNLGIALEGLGRRSEAIAHYREALRLKPGFSDAAHNLREATRYPTR